MGSVAGADKRTELCGGCSNPSDHLVSCVGDGLCARCRAVIWAAVVLLNRGITDEAMIIPTLVLAKVAGGSPGYAVLAEEGSPSADMPRLMLEAGGSPIDLAEDEYAGWELVTVLDGVPVARVTPVALKSENYAETTVLKRAEVQILSRRVKPETVKDRYEQVLRERGAGWSESNHGRIEYGFRNGFLYVRASNGFDDLDPRTVRTFGGDFFRHPAFHFPAPSLIAGFYRCLLGSADSRNAHGFSYALDVYGKPLKKSPMRLILAFVAWHVGVGYDAKRPRTQIPDKQRTEKFVDKHVIKSLDVPPKNPWLSARKSGEDAEGLGPQRFVRLYAMASAAPYQELGETPGF